MAHAQESREQEALPPSSGEPNPEEAERARVERRRLAWEQFESQPVVSEWVAAVEPALTETLVRRLAEVGVSIGPGALQCRQFWCAVEIPSQPDVEAGVARAVHMTVVDQRELDGKLLLARMGDVYYFRFVERQPADWAERWR